MDQVSGEAGGVIALVILIVVCVVALLFYFLPAFIAGMRGHQNTAAIFILNLLLGWSFLGWVAALVWSFTEVRRGEGGSGGGGAGCLIGLLVVVLLGGAVIGGVGFLLVLVPTTVSNLEQAKRDVARSQLRTIDAALMSYHLRHMAWPESLRELTIPRDGQSAALDADAILDPWGRAFQYDPEGPRHDGERPDVWSEGPDGSHDWITNW